MKAEFNPEVDAVAVAEEMSTLYDEYVAGTHEAQTMRSPDTVLGTRHFIDDQVELTKAQLDRLVRMRQLADVAITQCVAVMRVYDRPWREIAGTLGVSPQAAQQRYRDPVRQLLQSEDEED